MSPISSRNRVPRCACSNFPVCRDSRARKRTLLVPEQFCFHQFRRNRRAIQRNKRPRPAAGFFHAAFARSIPCLCPSRRECTRAFRSPRHAPPAPLLPSSPAGPHDVMPPEPPLQIAIFFLQMPHTQRVFHRQQKLFGGDGLLEKITARPSRVAFTAISIEACPDIITTGDASPIALKSSSSAMPSRPGITTSERIRSKRSAFANSSARAALSQTVASCPASRNARAKDASVFASSSIIRIWAFADTAGYASSSFFSKTIGKRLRLVRRLASEGRYEKKFPRPSRFPRKFARHDPRPLPGRSRAPSPVPCCLVV